MRNQYTTKLIAAVGGTISTSGNMPPASYGEAESGQSEPTVSFWGEVRQGIDTTGCDKFSVDCLGCHDGAAALLVTSVLINNPFNSGSKRKMNSMDHPIGMDYSSYVAAGKQYKPIAGTNDKMVFVNGKVGCLTCHDPMVPEKGHLVMSDRNSVLCLTCHNL
jgi:predicted CXXCH cytochrome family protein